MARLLIGDDRREAIDWLQDRLTTTRPIAEGAMLGLFREGSVITTDEGIFLVEEEEEFDNRIRSSIANNLSKNYSKARFRNRSRMKTTNNRRGKFKNDFSSAAEDMLRAETPLPDQSEDEK